MKYITKDFLYEISPKYSGKKGARQKEIIEAIGDEFDSILITYDIYTNLQISHFLAQAAHECAGFCTTEEFASGKAYEGRKDLGNINPGDGVRYKGRGIFQLTGRYNYRDMGRELNLPLEDQPQLAADPIVSLKIACEYWNSRNLNVLADKNDIHGITKKINGGLNGLESRTAYFRKIKKIIDDIENILKVKLKEKDQGYFVKLLQRKLNENGANVIVDGEFGKGTKRAVIEFQQKNHLVDDGIVGKNTWTVLM